MMKGGTLASAPFSPSYSMLFSEPTQTSPATSIKALRCSFFSG